MERCQGLGLHQVRACAAAEGRAIQKFRLESKRPGLDARPDNCFNIGSLGQPVNLLIGCNHAILPTGLRRRRTTA